MYQVDSKRYYLFILGLHASRYIPEYMPVFSDQLEQLSVISCSQSLSVYRSSGGIIDMNGYLVLLLFFILRVQKVYLIEAKRSLDIHHDKKFENTVLRAKNKRNRLRQQRKN